MACNRITLCCVLQVMPVPPGAQHQLDWGERWHVGIIKGAV